MAARREEKKETVLTVGAPLVQLRVGDRVIQLSEGDIVPDNADSESLDHLRNLGFVNESDAPAVFNDDEK